MIGGSGRPGPLRLAAVLAIASLGVPESDPDRRTFWILVAGVALCALVLWRPVPVSPPVA